MDDIDTRILRALERDGRQTNANLAETIGLSPSGTLDRVRRLERSGAILGYTASIAPEALGFGVQALVGVRLRVHKSDCVMPFERAVQEVDGVVSCYHVTGQFDYVLHVAAQDLADLRKLNNRRILAVPGLGRVDTMVILDEVKPNRGWPGADRAPAEAGSG